MLAIHILMQKVSMYHLIFYLNFYLTIAWIYNLSVPLDWHNLSGCTFRIFSLLSFSFIFVFPDGSYSSQSSMEHVVNI